MTGQFEVEWVLPAVGIVQLYFGGAAVVFPGDRLLAFKAREGIAIVDVLHRPVGAAAQ